MDMCPFCSEPSITARLVAGNSLVSAFPTNIPIVPGHTLIAPTRCVKTFAELTSEERGALWEMLQNIQNALRKSFDASGFNIAWNEGVAGGQSVPHFHLHVLPRKDGDQGVYQYDPRKFLYRPGSREPSPAEELQAVAAAIRAAL